MWISEVTEKKFIWNHNILKYAKELECIVYYNITNAAGVE